MLIKFAKWSTVATVQLQLHIITCYHARMHSYSSYIANDLGKVARLKPPIPLSLL